MPTEPHSPPLPEVVSPEAPPSLGRLLSLWLTLGFQSFGGGVATLTLIRRAFVEQHRWLTEAEFTRDWALCQIAPGINLLALTILIGRKLAGAGGVLVALLGLLLPSVSLTILITACYARFHDRAVVQAALRAVIPATVGLGAVTSWNMARPLLQESRREGRFNFGVSLALLIGAGLAAAAGHLPVLLVLCAAGGLEALACWLRSRRKTEEERAAR
jgi:chromate transporter